MFWSIENGFNTQIVVKTDYPINPEAKQREEKESNRDIIVIDKKMLTHVDSTTNEEVKRKNKRENKKTRIEFDSRVRHVWPRDPCHKLPLW